MNEKRVDYLLEEYEELLNLSRWLTWVKAELKEARVKGHSVYFKTLAKHIESRIAEVDRLLDAEEEELGEVG